MREVFDAKRPEILPHVELHSVSRALALEHVLGELRLPFQVVAHSGARFPDGDGVVPKGATYVMYDTGDFRPEQIWRRVDEISPIPLIDGRG